MKASGARTLILIAIAIPLFACVALYHNAFRIATLFDLTSEHTARESLQGKLLRAAVKFNDLSLVTECLEKGVDPNIPGSDGMTPLMVAAASGNSRVIPVLLNYNASVNWHNDHGETAPMLAADSGDIRAIQLILDAHPDLSITDYNHRTALDHARATERPQVIEEFSRTSRSVLTAPK